MNSTKYPGLDNRFRHTWTDFTCYLSDLPGDGPFSVEEKISSDCTHYENTSHSHRTTIIQYIHCKHENASEITKTSTKLLGRVCGCDTSNTSFTHQRLREVNNAPGARYRLTSYVIGPLLHFNLSTVQGQYFYQDKTFFPMFKVCYTLCILFL